MALRVQRDLALGRLEGEPALERLDHGAALEGARPTDGHRPQVPAVPDGAGRIRDVGVGLAVALTPARHPLSVHGVVELLEVGVDDDQPLDLLGGEHDLFVAEAKRRGHDGKLPLEAGGGELPVEGDVVAAHEERHHHVGLGALDPSDHRVEVDDVERDELLVHQGSPRLRQKDLHPVRRDVAVVVVGGQRVDLRAVLRDRPRDQRAELLGRRDPRAEDELVADAALILLVVEVDLLVLVHDGPDGLARGARDAAHEHGDLVVDQEPGRVLGVDLVVRLGVELDQLELLSEDAAVRVDVVDRELGRVDHRQPVDVDRPRAVEEAADRDLAALRGRPSRAERRRERRSHRPAEDLQRVPSVHVHPWPPGARVGSSHATEGNGRSRAVDRAQSPRSCTLYDRPSGPVKRLISRILLHDVPVAETNRRRRSRGERRPPPSPRAGDRSRRARTGGRRTPARSRRAPALRRRRIGRMFSRQPGSRSARCAGLLAAGTHDADVQPLRWPRA